MDEFPPVFVSDRKSADRWLRFLESVLASFDGNEQFRERWRDRFLGGHRGGRSHGCSACRGGGKWTYDWSGLEDKAEMLSMDRIPGWIKALQCKPQPAVWHLEWCRALPLACPAAKLELLAGKLSATPPTDWYLTAWNLDWTLAATHEGYALAAVHSDR